ncbi:MAG TPA: cysteine hydrolase [Candidatus Binatia bacterium]|jgi:nicotinamidase-related amidase|nr:cysteine hydrolase [Candidatus Binatia bacterium]
MDPKHIALVLIGYQNDYFAADGILHKVIEESSRVTGTLANTVDLIEHLYPIPILIVSTPIIFTSDYSELVESVGILKTVKEMGAFKAGTKGAETIPELLRFGERIMEVPGKRGLNAFSNTELDSLFRQRGITNVVLAGTATSICIDSTGRSAFERGYKVTILSDCTSGRTTFEQDFYCENVFPLYAEVIDHVQLLKGLGIVT